MRHDKTENEIVVYCLAVALIIEWFYILCIKQP